MARRRASAQSFLILLLLHLLHLHLSSSSLLPLLALRGATGVGHTQSVAVSPPDPGKHTLKLYRKARSPPRGPPAIGLASCLLQVRHHNI
ncbi:hypothetical protein DFJ73DRAFT_827354 [Zopfochytrium polystomum]|nr:hypothetical protein DFJ73DRAFT_827354 [Zopfochytrium polystomum]